MASNSVAVARHMPNADFDSNEPEEILEEGRGYQQKKVPRSHSEKIRGEKHAHRVLSRCLDVKSTSLF